MPSSPRDSPPFASVLVCTRNRSTDLTACCAGILAIDYPPERWELVIVDNGSTDDTRQVAEGVRQQAPDRVRVIEELELGLSAARNAAVRAARGEVLAFIDDDAFPAPGWLGALVEVLGRDDVYAAGGPVEPIFERSLPDWLDDRYLPYLTVWDRGLEIEPLVYNEYPRGANMAYRREAFARFGDFSHHLGRKGKRLLSCEETEHCLRIERGGGIILYTPDARVRHRVVVERIDQGWMAARFRAQGRSEAILEWRHAGLAGLRIGLERTRTYARNARRSDAEGSDLHHRLLRCAVRGYLLGALEAVIRVPRYQPSPEVGPAAPWLPFS